MFWCQVLCFSTFLKYPLAVLAQTPATYILMYCNASSTAFPAEHCFQFMKKTSDVCCLMSNIRRLMLYVMLYNCYQMSDDSYMTAHVCCQLSDIRHLITVTWQQTSDVRCLISDVCCHITVIRRLISDFILCYITVIRHLMSNIRPLIWHQMSDNSYMMSDLW